MASALLARIEPLAHPARVKALWEYGRNHPVAEIVADLESWGGYYEQRVAATLASAAGDTTWAAAHLADPNPSVRCMALRLAPRLPVSAIKDALHDAPVVVRFPLYRNLKGHSSLADELVETVREEWGEDEATRVLRWCSEPVIRRLLPSFLLAFSRNELWHRLAISHHQTLLQALAADLDHSVKDGITRGVWWNRYETAFVILLKRGGNVAAKEAIEFLEARKLRSSLPFYDYIKVYARFEPERALSYLTKLGRKNDYYCTATRVYRRLVRSGCPLAEVEGLTKAVGTTDNEFVIAPYLKAFAPSDRVKHYELIMGGKPDELFRYKTSPYYDSLPCLYQTTPYLSILPKSYLVRKAREALPFSRAKGQGAHFLPLAFLPQDEVQDELLEGTRRPDPNERGRAWKWYITNGELNGPPALAKVAGEAACRLRDEQQPVRRTVICALAAVPARLWNEDALEHLTAVMKNAADARDEAGEWKGFHSIATAVLVVHPGSPRHVEWVQESFAILSELGMQIDLPRRDRFDVPRLDELDDGQEETIWNVYKPYIAAAAANDHRILIDLASGLGERAADVLEPQHAIEAHVARLTERLAELLSGPKVKTGQKGKAGRKAKARQNLNLTLMIGPKVTVASMEEAFRTIRAIRELASLLPPTISAPILCMLRAKEDLYRDVRVRLLTAESFLPLVGNVARLHRSIPQL